MTPNLSVAFCLISRFRTDPPCHAGRAEVNVRVAEPFPATAPLELAEAVPSPQLAGGGSVCGGFRTSHLFSTIRLFFAILP